jgi:phosphopantothenoylcysteine decarboxylase/phosphopantothenate--cysteine ligase
MKRKILLGITGSIAAYKIPYFIRELRQQGDEVRVILSRAAKSFITPLTLQALSNHPVYEELLDSETEQAMEHIQLARWADVILVVPATAHLIAKLAHGFADDLLSTLCLASPAPIIVAPAMNQQMWLHAATQENIAKLKQRGILCWGPDEGLQACGDDGPGRMLEPLDLLNQLNIFFLSSESQKFLNNKNILITAGPTQEAIDPVRYMSNRSSGKMGYALAKAAIEAGARVTLISGPVALNPISGCELMYVKTAQDMLLAVEKNLEGQDIFIGAAAVADYCLEKPAEHKIKKDVDMILKLTKTPDIISLVAQKSNKPFIVGFCAETDNLLENAENKRLNKKIDMIIANDVSRQDIGFDSDENEVVVITKSEKICLKKASKIFIALEILKIINRIIA